MEMPRNLNVQDVLVKYALLQLELDREKRAHLNTIALLGALKSGAITLDRLQVNHSSWSVLPASEGGTPDVPLESLTSADGETFTVEGTREDQSSEALETPEEIPPLGRN